MFISSKSGPHPALLRPRLQLLSLFFLCLSACISPPPGHLSASLPEGYYRFNCPIAYDNDMVKLTHEKGRVRVQLLEDYMGNFALKVDPDGSLKIVDDHMDYPGLPRSFKGEGRMLQPGSAEGSAVLWLKSAGPISRNHREGPWTLRRAGEKEIQDFLKKQQTLEIRRQRAREAGLKIP